MFAMLAAQRGRSKNVHVYSVTLPEMYGGDGTYQACGLLSGPDGFEPGDFIGFYTGKWGTRKQLGGSTAYTVAVGDDFWHVAPPGSRTRRVHLGLHAMAAINEPGRQPHAAR